MPLTPSPAGPDAHSRHAACSSTHNMTPRPQPTTTRKQQRNGTIATLVSTRFKNRTQLSKPWKRVTSSYWKNCQRNPNANPIGSLDRQFQHPTHSAVQHQHYETWLQQEKSLCEAIAARGVEFDGIIKRIGVAEFSTVSCGVHAGSIDVWFHVQPAHRWFSSRDSGRLAPKRAWLTNATYGGATERIRCLYNGARALEFVHNLHDCEWDAYVTTSLPG